MPRREVVRRCICAQMHDDVDEYCMSDLEYSSEEEWEDEECIHHSLSSNHLDIWSLLQSKKYDNPTQKREPLSNTSMSKETEHYGPTEMNTRKSEVNTNASEHTIEEEYLLVEQVGFATTRLVRSKSFDGNPIPDERHSCRRPRSHTLSTFAATAPPLSSRRNPSFCCIQALLPSTINPCAVGPMPRASLEIVSCHAAVAMLWSLDRAPSIVPMVNCGTTLEIGWKIAHKMQSVLRERIARHQNGSLSGYLMISEEIASRRDEWTELLDDCISLDEHDSLHPFHLLKPICERKGLSFGESHDRFDLFRMVTSSLHQVKAESTGTTEDSINKRVCLICFDGLPDHDGAAQMIPCGHSVCSECLIAYIASAAGSGQSSVNCPAFKCPTRLGTYDIAHALFDDNCTTAYDPILLFDKLVRFEIEKTGMDYCLARGKTRYCPSATCERVLVSCGDGIDPMSGSNIFTCICGISLCADKCKDGGPSHPGIPCCKFQELRNAVDSGKLDAEVTDIQWMLKHSRPCPKCRYPIQRDGGCNHVRCTSCDYSFCWHCGGPGYECMAFFCKNQGKYWHEQPQYDEKQYGDLYLRVKRFRSYRSAIKKLKILRKTLTDDKTRDKCVRLLTLLDLQLTQVALWIHGKSLTEEVNVSANGKYSSVDRPALQKTEFMMHVLSLRNVMVRNRLKTLQEGPFTTDEVAIAMGFQISSNTRAKTQDKIHQEALKQMREQECLIVDQDLEELCKLPDVQLEREVRDTIKRAVAYLIPNQTCRSSQKNRRKNNQKEDMIASGRLNVKLNRRADPWRTGWRRDRNEKGDNDSRNRRWRKGGKQVVATRRQHAIEQRIV